MSQWKGVLKDPKTNQREDPENRERRDSSHRPSPESDSQLISQEKSEIKRQWNYIFEVLKRKGSQSRIPYPSKLSLLNEGQINTFPDKEK